MRHAVIVGLSFVLAACSEPFTTGGCMGANVEEPGGNCALPLLAIRVDGDFRDWPQIKADVDLGRTDDALVFRATWPSNVDFVGTEFQQGLGEAAGVTRGFLRSTRGDQTVILEGDIALRRGPAFETAFVSGSNQLKLEQSIALSGLPYEGSAWIFLTTYRLVNGRLSLTGQQGPFLTCWRPDDIDSPCNVNVATNQ